MACSQCLHALINLDTWKFIITAQTDFLKFPEFLESLTNTLDQRRLRQLYCIHRVAAILPYTTEWHTIFEIDFIGLTSYKSKVKAIRVM